ncbi:hypothetical protein ACH41H_16140 [Streptomyces sp. NPDC020800]|uniref:hypothetical protein n=1 Tax=Streptomyces sp. NPDC020800 TaxID=3365092 RepID=UPI0037B03B3B
MSGTGGKDIKAEGLDEIAQGITLTLAELKDLGVDSLAGAGRGFSNMELSGMQMGHEGLTSKFKSFCERWEWGVRTLVLEGNAFAQDVGLAAGTLYETDQYVGGALKIGANSLWGNPYASEDDIQKQSWHELARNSADAYANPDVSQKSFEEAWQHTKQSAENAGHDVMTAKVGPTGFGPVGVSADDFEHTVESAEGGRQDGSAG